MGTYLDHNAASPLRPEALEAMLPWLKEDQGNASSTHQPGQKARHAVEGARDRIAALLNCKPDEIIFTAGATEACNLALQGHALRVAQGGGKARLLVGATEHPAVMRTAEALAGQGHGLKVLAVEASGRLNLDAFDAAGTLACVMLANNETGVLHPLPELSQRCRAAGVLVFSDLAQALGKVRVDLGQVDLAAASAQKFGGPKGAGFLFVRKGVRLDPLLHGGEQEQGLRPGTEDVAAIVGMAAALELALKDLDTEASRLAGLRDALQVGVLKMAPWARVNGDGAERVPGTLSVSLPGLESDALLIRLDQAGVHLSAGSACAAGAVQASKVLQAMGVEGPALKGVLRFSLGWNSQAKDVDIALGALEQALDGFRAAGLLAPA